MVLDCIKVQLSAPRDPALNLIADLDFLRYIAYSHCYYKTSHLNHQFMLLSSGNRCDVFRLKATGLHFLYAS